MRAALVLVAILGAACSAPVPTCLQVADRVMGIAAHRAAASGHDTVGARLHRKTAERCEAESWSADGRACIAAATSLTDVRGCSEDVGDVAVELAGDVNKELDYLDAEQRATKSGLKVNLPAGTSAEIDPSQASLVIEIANDRAYVQGKAMSDADMENLFRVAYARDKRTQVIIKADRGVGHGRVVGIMESAKAAGLTRLAIGTSSN